MPATGAGNASLHPKRQGPRTGVFACKFGSNLPQKRIPEQLLAALLQKCHSLRSPRTGSIVHPPCWTPELATRKLSCLQKGDLYVII